MEQEFVTLPREVVEQALDAFDVATTPLARDRQEVLRAQAALRAALKQPQNYALDAGNMVPAGWKLVPVEPTRDMLDFAEKFAPKTPRAQYLAMLDAAPQPPAPGCKATKRGDHVVCDDCKSAWDANDKNPPACVPAPQAVDQPQANQPAMTPIAQRKLDSLLTEGYTISGYSVYHERKHQHGFVTGAGLVGWWKPEGVEHPQQRCEQEPDWSYSKTLPSELWKNPLLSLQERLQIADGAVQWNREVAENLRARLCAAQQPQAKQEPVAVIGDVWTLNWVGGDPIATIVKKHGLKIGDKLYTYQQPKRDPLTVEQIDAIADAMPGGLEGFMKGWGWRQFARAVIEATHNIK